MARFLNKMTLSVSLTGDMDHFVMSNLTNFTITKICETKTILKLKHHQDRVTKSLNLKFEAPLIK